MRCVAVVILFFALVPSLAVARGYDDSPPEADQVGFILAAGVGYGKPLGEVYHVKSYLVDTSLDSSIAAQVPLLLSLGLRPSPYLSFGVAFQYAPLITKNCDAGATCSASDTYLGGEMRTHLLPGRLVCPWISLGLGFEWLSVSETIRGQKMDGGFSGLNYDIEIGTDILITRTMAVGPYFGVRFGKYGTVSGRTYGDTSIPDEAEAVHGWWVLGVRGALTTSSQ